MNQQQNQQATTTNTKKDNDLSETEAAEIQRKISLATEGFTTSKYCELVLKDSNRLSKKIPLQFATIS